MLQNSQRFLNVLKPVENLFLLRNGDLVFAEQEQSEEIPHALHVSAGLANEQFNRDSAGEVPGPESVWVVSVGEKIVEFWGVGDLLLVDRFEVNWGGRVNDLGIEFWARVDVVHEFVHVFHPNVALAEAEVGALKFSLCLSTIVCIKLFDL